MLIAEYFADQSKLAEVFPQYVVREGQVKMAEAISNSIENRNALMIEAGTGIGKTLAYLVPALISGKKVVISTGTKALQDQLFFRDLPRVIQSLLIPISTSLLKGRANYVCHYHLGRAINNSQFTKEFWYQDLHEISSFSQNSFNGDKADCQNVSEQSIAWNYAVSTRDNCLSLNCPNLDQCFVFKARKNAFAADVLVVNHHLFFADIAIKENRGQDLLPDTHVVIFDEAHQVKEIASDFFSTSISTGQLRELARDARKEFMNTCADIPEIHKYSDQIEYKSSDLLYAIQKLPEKVDSNQALSYSNIKAAFDELVKALQILLTNLELVAERSISLQKIAERTQYAKNVITLWLNPKSLQNIQLAANDHATEEELINQLNINLNQTSFIHWLEKKEHYAKIIRTPLSIEESMERQYNLKPRSWIYCSSTLAIGNDFSLFKKNLGLSNIDRGCYELVISSPFDYPNNSCLYIPKDLPSPTDNSYFDQLISTITPLIDKCQGGIFILCTSFRAVNQFKKILPTIIKNRIILTQTEMTNHQLLSEFRECGNAILIGTMTFWEGVDFQGPTLSMVIIDKLPFAPPDDPIQIALSQEIKKNGGNPFFELQIPQAAILLKQGAGRLIRSEKDRGVLVICDSRIHFKGYGRKLLQAIPPMRQTENQSEVIEFLENIN